MSGHVLIVDDEPSVRSLVRDVLELDDYEVSEAKDGTEALEMFKSGNYDLLVLDIMMPGISGLDVLKEIRATVDTEPDYAGSAADTPVILLTAASDDDTTWQGWTSGASVFIAKPFDPANLSEWVERTLADRTASNKPTVDPATTDISAEFRGLAQE